MPDPDGPRPGGLVRCRTCGTAVPPGLERCPTCGADAPTNRGPLPGLTVISTIGRGGTSVVYLAQQDELERLVAVKVITHAVDDPKVWRAFQREARAIALLSGHHHVVNVYTTGRTTAGEPFLVTEYLDRGSLADVLAVEGSLPVPTVARIGAAIADALGAAHLVDVLHRDVKPGNVLLSWRDDVKLGDFGIARLVAAHAALTTGTVAFTPQHVAPEVLRGEPEGPWTDTYGLASTLVTALIGHPPFEAFPGEQVAAVMARKLDEAPPELPASVPGPLASALVRALALDPAERPSLGELQAVLKRYAGATPLPPPVGPPAPGPGPTPLFPTAGAPSGPGGTATAATRATAGSGPVAPGARAGAPAVAPPVANLPVGARAAGPASTAAGPAPGLPPTAPLPVTAAGAPGAAGSAPPPHRAMPPGGQGPVLPPNALQPRRTPLVLGAAVLALVIALAVVIALRNRDEEGQAAPATTAAPPTTAVASTTAPATTAPAATAPRATAPTTARPVPTAPASSAAPTRPPASATTAAPTTTPTTAAPPATGAAVADPEGFVRTYYATLAQRDYARAWSMLSPEFQQAQPGSYAQYVAFWQGVSGIVVRSVDVRGGGDRPVCRLGMRYTIGDRTTDETDEVTLRVGDAGLPVIATYRVVGPG